MKIICGYSTTWCKLPFSEQSIQDLKVINQDTCEKGYHIYSMYNRLLTFF